MYRGDATLAYAGKSDEELMLLYQQGEVGAFEELYERHSPKLYAFLKIRVQGPGEAEDLLQQVCLKVHKYRYHFNVSLPFLPWLFSITRRTLIDHVRKHQPVSMENSKLEALADKNLIRGPEEEKANWKELIELLPVEQRKLIEMRFAEGMSFEEIAGQVAITKTTARKRVSRSLRRMRDLLSGRKKGAKQ